MRLDKVLAVGLIGLLAVAACGLASACALALVWGVP